MKKIDIPRRMSAAALVIGFVVIGVRSTDAAHPSDAAGPLSTAVASPVDTAGPLPTPAATPATVDQLVAANPGLASAPRADLQYRLDHPVHYTPPRLSPEAGQALAQSGTYSYADGMPAIQPRTPPQAGNATAAAYDTATVVRYFANNIAQYWVAGAPGAGKLLRVQFMTAAQAKALHPMVGSIRPDSAVICYVELAGPVLRDDHSHPPLPASMTVAPQQIVIAAPTGEEAFIPSATYVFDAQTGNELMMF